MASPKKISNKELAWYVIAGIVGVVGLTSLVFGIIGEHFPGLYSDNWIAAGEAGWLKAWSGLGYRWWGIILLAIAVFLAVVVANVFAKEGDRDVERALRRQQRLAMTQQVVEGTVSEETPSQEEPKPEA